MAETFRFTGDRALLERLEGLSEADRAGFEFPMGPMTFGFDGFVGLRLNCDRTTVHLSDYASAEHAQIRIFDQGVPPPMDLAGAFLLHTAPGVRKLGTDSEGRGRYEKVCIGTTTSARITEWPAPQYSAQSTSKRPSLVASNQISV